MMPAPMVLVLLVLPLAACEKSIEESLGGIRRMQARDASICSKTSPAVLVAHSGTLSDDDTQHVNCAHGGCNGGDNTPHGYGDNLDCGKAIHAPKGSVIQVRFTYMALEAGKMCKKPGCDTITVYDGPNANSRVLGVFSGLKNPPPVRSTGPDMFIRFKTDEGNFGFGYQHISKDPGFYLDWHFIQQIDVNGAKNDQFTGNQVGGTGICPAASVLTEAHGVLHDDEVGNVDCSKNGGQCGSRANQGYGDNLNCYTTIHAPKGDRIQFTFTQMNLEGPGQKPGCQPCTDKRGCDWVELYDGKDNKAKLIGTYSGHHLGWIKGEDQLPSIMSTGQDLHIRFRTDAHNCGIDSSEDPGWIGEWNFVESGVNICHPGAGVLRNSHGVLHDDAVGNKRCMTARDCGGLDPKGGANVNGYSDNLDCGVRLHAPKGQTINVHFTQMNIEGVGAGGLCDHDVGNMKKIDCSKGGDFVTIYDGRSAKSKVLAKVTGDIADSRIHADSFTSSGRDMFVRFTTDKGNYGLTGSNDEPGFWLEWHFVKNGVACSRFQVLKGMGIVGHNNENFNNKNINECEHLCCARAWCRSFDFVGNTAGRGTCALSDVDVTHNGATTTKWNGNVYEKPAAPAPSPIKGPQDCARMLASIGGKINAECCPRGGCKHGPPTRCSDECDQVWSPFQKQCAVYVHKTMGRNFNQITDMCQKQEYGTYHKGSNHGRCGSGDFQQWIEQLGPACCGGPAAPGTAQSPHCKGAPNKYGFMLPTVNGARTGSQAYCSPQCARLYNEWYAECNPRFKDMGKSIADGMFEFLGVCQKMGGAHRRLSLTSDVATAVADAADEARAPAPVDEEASIFA